MTTAAARTRARRGVAAERVDQRAQRRGVDIGMIDRPQPGRVRMRSGERRKTERDRARHAALGCRVHDDARAELFARAPTTARRTADRRRRSTRAMPTCARGRDDPARGTCGRRACSSAFATPPSRVPRPPRGSRPPASRSVHRRVASRRRIGARRAGGTRRARRRSRPRSPRASRRRCRARSARAAAPSAHPVAVVDEALRFEPLAKPADLAAATDHAEVAERHRGRSAARAAADRSRDRA